MNRSDYEELFGPDKYPKPTAAAACELVTRGLKANVGTLDYLVRKGVVAVPQGDGGKRLWARRHIDQAAQYLDEIEAYTPGTWQHVLEYTNPAQDIRAFREACSNSPHVPPNHNCFIRIVTPGLPGLDHYATVHYRSASALDWLRQLKRQREEVV